MTREADCFYFVLCFHSYSGSAMNVVFSEEEMKKFLVEAARVSQVPVFTLLLLLHLVPAVSFSHVLFSICF